VRVVVAVTAIALLGAAPLTPMRPQGAPVHVRWTIRYHDLTATADTDVVPSADPVTNTGGLFPMAQSTVPQETHQRLRIAVGARTVFDRALTREEIGRFGHVQALHVANDVRGAGERDLAADGTAIFRYVSAPPAYRLADAVGPDFGAGSRAGDCDRKGSFELERVAADRDRTVRIVQRGEGYTCLRRPVRFGEIVVTESGKTVFSSRATMAREGEPHPANAAAVLQITDGPSFVDLNGSGTPVILITGLTGGAHCCFQTYALRRMTGGRYAEALRDWGNALSYPVLLRDVRRGEIVFGSTNDQFAWSFGAYGNAVEPVQIVAFEHGRFREVTRRYPEIVRRQAGLIWAQARMLLKARRSYDAQPAIGAYIWDMTLLGRAGEGWRNVASACATPACRRSVAEVRTELRWVTNGGNASPLNR
jgi:hypothetical protein